MARLTVALTPIPLAEDTDMAALLRSLMAQSGIPGAQLAQTTGFTHRAISMWRVGKRSPELLSLMRLVDAFGFEVTLTPKVPRGDYDFGEGTCPAEHADARLASGETP